MTEPRRISTPQTAKGFPVGRQVQSVSGADSARNQGVCVLDVGKTNVKLSALTAHGEVLQTLAVENPVRPGPPWRHHDLSLLGGWVLDGIRSLARDFPISTFVTTAHGSGGVLVGSDPAEGDGTALPMIDYEQPLPADVAEAYPHFAGSFHDRGSAIMHGATHQARQLLWMEMAEPARFREARWFLNLPQYWAWWLTGHAVSERTSLGAQSHLWNTPDDRPAPIVGLRGWGHLLPDIVPAWTNLGRLRRPLVDRFGLPENLTVLAGIHDSSANLYRYQAAGRADAAILSTGTWIVGMSGQTPLDDLNEHAGMTINSDVYGRPIAGALVMGGREFAHVAGEDGHGPVDIETVLNVMTRGTMAMPSFGDGDGFFPGSAGRGHVTEPALTGPRERRALALIYVAQLAVECLDALKVRDTVVLDGSYLRDPLFARLVSTFRRGGETLINLDTYGVATGAALLASHATSVAAESLHLQTAEPITESAELFQAYHRRWREDARR